MMAQCVTLLLPLLLILLSTTYAAVYNITDFGAKPDDQTDSAKALTDAWAQACGSPEPSTVQVPEGNFSIGPVTLSGPCKSSITVRIVGTLVAPSYTTFDKEARYWILFSGVNNVAIFGGTIDGQGASLWACKIDDISKCPSGVNSLTVEDSNNVLIDGLNSINSMHYHIWIESSQSVTIQGGKISAPEESPNTDGIHTKNATFVTIKGTIIETGDDCISIVQGSTNHFIEGVSCGPGHGISIGSLGVIEEEAGVSNITVKSTTFKGSDNGFRIKTWPRLSNGFVKDVKFVNATMQDVKNPIYINQYYCSNLQACPSESSGIKISGVTYEDIQGSSRSEVAVNFNCSASTPCTGIQLNNNVKLTYSEGTAQASCVNAFGTASGVFAPPSCLKS